MRPVEHAGETEQSRWPAEDQKAERRTRAPQGCVTPQHSHAEPRRATPGPCSSTAGTVPRTQTLQVDLAFHYSGDLNDEFRKETKNRISDHILSEST